MMARPPDLDSLSDTIDQADLAGWTHLATECRCGTTHHPWLMLRRATRYRRLDEIVMRLRCSKCGQRPARAWLYWQGRPDMREAREKVIFCEGGGGNRGQNRNIVSHRKGTFSEPFSSE